MPPTFEVDAAYAPELVEYWAKKYRDVKVELYVRFFLLNYRIITMRSHHS